MFAALALDWVGIAGLRHACTFEQVRDWAAVYAVIRGLGAGSVAALLVFGLYLTAVTWGPTGWIGIGFLSLLLIAALGAASGIRLSRILAAAGSLLVVAIALAFGLVSAVPVLRQRSLQARST